MTLRVIAPPSTLQADKRVPINTTLLHEMKRRAPSAPRPYYGMAMLCVGVGQGEATIVEWAA
jgi:hypothetical protein